MKKFILITFALLLFFLAVNNGHAATNPSLDMLRDLFNVFPSSQNTTTPSSLFEPPASPDTNPPANTPIDGLFPDPLNSLPSNFSEYERNGVLSCLGNRTLYDQASSYTGLPWQIFAAIHYLEAGCGQGSLVSGRRIGQNEVDVVRSGGCSSARSGPGIPIPLPGGGCGFASLLDSAIYAGRHLQGKIGKIPETFNELVIALGRYNGRGNSNCGRTPYTNCPPYFESEDHIYPLSWFDERHGDMYLVYCADRTRCDPPRLYLRPGAMTILRILEGK